MSDDKAARLAAIRAKNAANQPAAAAVAPASALAPAVVDHRPPAAHDEDIPAIAGASVIALLLAVALGALAAAVALPRWLPGLSASLLGDHPTAFWYLSRSSAMVSYALVWLSMVLGLSLTGRIARLWPGGPTALDMHQHASILGLAFGLFHALILLGDRYIDYSLRSVLVPFASAGYKPLWVGLGQLSLYGFALVTLSFYVKKWIGRRAWRIIHYASFLLFLTVLAHGAASGSDTSRPLISGFYWATGGSVVFLTAYRILVRLKSKG